MNDQSDIIEAGESARLATEVRFVEQLNELKAIHERHVAGVILQRKPVQSFQPWIASLPPEKLPSLRTIVPVESAVNALNTACDTSGTPAGIQRDALVQDAANLAKTFAVLLNVSHLRIRFDVVRDNACRKFHLDQVPARLICTYRGLGTQYGRWQHDADPAQIFDVPTGSPLLLRGALWDKNSPVGIVHRSPPIEGSGQTRLVLVLDPIYDPESEG